MPYLYCADVTIADKSPLHFTLLALNDILHDLFPKSLEDYAIYVRAMDARKATEQFDILCRAVDMPSAHVIQWTCHHESPNVF